MQLIILDEADSMTSAAQQALRRTMEIYSSTTRFALACNISTKIIEPIQSRCAILRFSRLSDADVLLRLQQVCSVEGVSHTPDGLASLLFTAEGDMRNALNNLQSTHAGFKHVSQETVLRVCDQPHPAVIKQVLMSCVKDDIRTAMDNMKSLYDTGYAVNDIIGTGEDAAISLVVKFLKACLRYPKLRGCSLLCFPKFLRCAGGSLTSKKWPNWNSLKRLLLSKYPHVLVNLLALTEGHSTLIFRLE